MRVILSFAVLLLAAATVASAQEPPAYPPADPPPPVAEPPAPAEPAEPAKPDEPAAWEPAVHTVVVDQFYSGIGASKRGLIRTQEEWSGFWQDLYGDQEPIPPPPGIDFDTHMVVVAAMGTRPTEGHGIEIGGVLVSEDGIQVEVIETTPGEACVVNEAQTAPVTAVTVERRQGAVTFNEREEVRPCG